MQPRSAGIRLGEINWFSKLLAAMAVRRRRDPSTQGLSDHLLRDAGLERIGGQTRCRLR
jgi:hypothetical protein